MQKIPDSYVLLTCGQCGHTADFLEFRETPITGELPPDSHQCPKCRKAWRMEIVEPGWHSPSGYYIPPKRKAKPIQSFL